MLQTNTIKKGSILSFCKVLLSQTNVSFGILTSNGLVQCMMPTCGHTLQFKKIVKLQDLHFMFWLEMQHTHVIHGCSCHSRGIKMGSSMGNITAILFNVPHGCVWNMLTKKEINFFIEKTM